MPSDLRRMSPAALTKAIELYQPIVLVLLGAALPAWRERLIQRRSDPSLAEQNSSVSATRPGTNPLRGRVSGGNVEDRHRRQ
jgi:hypothetical protein